MRLRQLATDDDAVSPVIGVILMVAITVILAAVIASFVLGLGGQTQTTPSASIGWDWDGSDSGNLTITHESGESIKYTELFVRGDPGNGGNINVEWRGTNSTTIGSTSAVASGDKFILSGLGTGTNYVDNNDFVTSEGNIGSGYDLDLIWQPEDGDTSATLGEDTGPDA